MYAQPVRNASTSLVWGSRVTRRFASSSPSTKPPPRKGRKGHLYGPKPSHPDVTPEEAVRITKRRIEKAERDERMDITLALTPVKTYVSYCPIYVFRIASNTTYLSYMGGFTRPRDLRSSNWWRGGRYAELGKVYECPPESAYEPHTVFLLESRYPVKHGVGRVDSVDHVVGVCREGDFEAVLKRYNSPRAPPDELEAMDNARWPWGPQYQLKRTKWWGPGENPHDIIKEIFGEEGIDSAYLDESGKFAEFEEESEDAEDPRQPMSKQKNVARASPSFMAALESSKMATPSGVDQRRQFHSSPRTSGAHSYNEDHIVPDFYVQHKRRKNPDSAPEEVPIALKSKARQRSATHESLMENLSDSLLSGEVAAHTMKRLRSKIPHEHYDKDGVLVQASGYVVPSPGEAPEYMSEKRKRDLSKPTAAIADSVQAAGDFSSINAHTRLQGGKVPYEIIEEDGSVSHPSGFVPPTAAHEFKYSDSSSIDNHVQDAVQRQRRRGSTIHLSPEEMAERQRKSDAIVERDKDDAELLGALKAGLREAANKGQKRGFHTSAVARASEVDFQLEEGVHKDGHLKADDRSVPPHIAGQKAKLGKFPGAGKAPKVSKQTKLSTPPKEIPPEIKNLRARYMPTLEENPFWRPLLTATFSTRPLAVTMARLSRALPRGLPFYASVNNDDRKTRYSYPDRIRNLRVERMTSLSVDIAQLLAGARGGFIGIRFSPQDTARGINGAGLEAPLPKEKRTVKIGIGNWYARAEDLKEAFREDAKTQIGEVGVGLEDIGETFEIAGLDDFGKRIDDTTGEVIPWRESKTVELPDFAEFFDTKKLDEEAAAFADGEESDGIVSTWRSEAERNRMRKIRRQELAREHKYEIATMLAQRHRSVTAP